MIDSQRFMVAAQCLVDTGRMIYERGWSPATSSNYSLRLTESSCAITVSGRHKGKLDIADVMAVDLSGQALMAGTPSAETLLHTQIYRRLPEVGAVLHTHSVMATVLTMHQANRRSLVFSGYEIQKAFDGVTSHDAFLTFPIFDNEQDIPSLAAKVEAWLTASAPLYGYLIRGHGVYVWGKTMDDCFRHLEAMEFLLSCDWQRYLASR